MSTGAAQHTECLRNMKRYVTSKNTLLRLVALSELPVLIAAGMYTNKLSFS